MHIVVAPDSFKGSLSAVAVAQAMAEGVHLVLPDARVTQMPIADGGEGTVDALVTGTNGKRIRTSASDPLGRPVDAYWGLLGDGDVGVVEVASASGLHLVQKVDRDPLTASSFGTGQIIKAVLDFGVRTLIIGLGGSATNDGGVGLFQALGARFTDDDGYDLGPGGAGLTKLANIDLTGLHPGLSSTTIWLASDVTNPLCGERGASAVYGPQKGASPEVVAQLDAGLRRFAQIATRTTGRAVSEQPGAGAAGGIGAGFLFFTNARVRPGIEMVLETIQFDKVVQSADLVLTGEGNTDFQTAYGKAPVGVARVAAQYQIPTVCISGGLGHGYEEIFSHGIRAAATVVPGPMTTEDAMCQAQKLVVESTANALRWVQIGMDIDKRQRH